MRTLDLGRARPGRAVAIFSTLAVIVLLAGCGAAAGPAYDGGAGQPNGNGGSGAGTGSGTGSGIGSGTGTGSDQGASGGAGSSSGNADNQGGGNGAGNGTPVLDVARPDLLVIKTGTLTVEVTSIDAAVSAATTEMRGLGGYISGSSQTGDADQVSASVTYRIPSDRWEDALIALRSLATKVVAEQTQTDDVTTQVVDLGARVRNLQATERAIQDVMAKAVTIDQILTVQAELTRIRGEIEQAGSAKAHLEEQATYSTLTVRFGLAPAPAPSPSPSVAVAEPAFDPGSEVARATGSLAGILQRLATVGIWFGIVWLPILLVLVATGLLAIWIFRRITRTVGRSLEAPPA